MTDQDIIDNACRTFDFERVHKAMTAVEWKWVGVGTPTVEKLREHAAETIQRLLDDKSLSSTGSGGMYARRYTDGDYKLPVIELEFVMAETSVLCD